MDEHNYTIDSYAEYKLDDFIIKDKEYRRKRLIKGIIIFSIIFSILIIIATVIVVVFVIKKIEFGKIKCVYQTLYNNEKIDLINAKDEDISFDLIIDEEEFNQENNHTFTNKGLHKITFIFKNKLRSLAKLFTNKNSLIEADLSELEVDEITSLNNLFSNCNNLKNAKLGFSGTNQIKDMSKLFINCSSLESVKFNFNAENVTDMSNMFTNCYSLKSIEFNNFNTKNLKYMESMFNSCKNLTLINLSSFNFEKVVNKICIFRM